MCLVFGVRPTLTVKQTKGSEMTATAYTNVTADDWVMADDGGIGAQDGDYIDLTDVTEWHEDDPAPIYQAGTLYADAIRGANAMRRRAYPLADSWNGHILRIERERGIPAW